MCTCDKSYKSIPPVNRVKRVNSVRLRPSACVCIRASVFVQMIACATGSVLRVCECARIRVCACSRVSVNDRMCTCDKSYKSIPPVNRVKRVNSVRLRPSASVCVRMHPCICVCANDRVCDWISFTRVRVCACSRVSVNDRMCTCDKSYKSISPVNRVKRVNSVKRERELTELREKDCSRHSGVIINSRYSTLRVIQLFALFNSSRYSTLRVIQLINRSIQSD